MGVLTQMDRIRQNIANTYAVLLNLGATMPEQQNSDNLAATAESVKKAELPTLSNEGTASDLMQGKELLDGSGNKVSGTFTIDSEISEQDSLLEQLRTALQGKMVVSGGGSEPDPREEYQRVEYITSSSGTYFATDFIADNDSGIEVVASFPHFADHACVGAREDSGNTRFFAPYLLSSRSAYCGFNTAQKIDGTFTVDTVYRLQTNFLNCRLANVYDESGNQEGSESISETLTVHTRPVYIFSYNSAGNSINPRVLSLYGVRCSRKNEVVREYIPCYRKSDGEIGLYEKFTKTFLSNAGSGTFTKGADIDW